MEETGQVKCSQCGSSFNKMFLLGKQGNANVCPLCGAVLTNEEEHSDWITWYYYGYKSDNGKTACLEDSPIDLTQHGDTFFLIKEFKAPPRDSNGRSDKAKEILRTYIPDAFSETKAKEASISCPRCGCSEFTLLNRGYSIWTGFQVVEK